MKRKRSTSPRPSLTRFSTLPTLKATGASITTPDAGNRFAFLVAYDGTPFHGWQIQPKNKQYKPNTIQAHVEKRISSLLRRPIHIIANGRTDAGVHSKGTVFHLDLLGL